MFSSKTVQLLSRSIWIPSRLYAIPSLWNPESYSFEFQRIKSHLVIEACVGFFEFLYRVWCHFAYTWLIWENLQSPDTVTSAIIPIAYLCSMVWCLIVKYTSHVYRREVEQWVNGLLQNNTNLTEYLRMFDSKMEHQKLLQSVMYSMEMTSVVCAIAPGIVWSQNLFDVNGFVYFFGDRMKWVRYAYNLSIFLWIYWNWKLFFYFILLNFVYLYGTYSWLREIKARYSKDRLSFSEALQLYRSLFVVHVLYRQVSNRFLPIAMAWAQVTLIATLAFVLLFYNRLGFIITYIELSIAFCNFFIMVTITKLSSLVTTTSTDLLTDLKNTNLSRTTRIRLKPVLPIQIYVGNYYFVDPGTLLVTTDIVISNLINVLLFFR